MLPALTPQPAAATLVSSSALAPVTGAIFNKPTGTDAERQAIDRHLVGLIDGTPGGSNIKIAIYTFSSDSDAVADALIAAKNRGVNVQLIVSSVAWNNAPLERLKASLGTDKSRSSWTMPCPGDPRDEQTSRSCIGQSQPSINHNKFFLFSRTGSATKVVVQSSANLNRTTGHNRWNNAVTLTGAGAIYDDYVRYFIDMKNLRHSDDYYNLRPPVQTSAAKVYHFPRKGTSASTDTIYNILKLVSCKGNSSVGTVDGRTIVRVGMALFSRYEVARKLRELDSSGCYVDVVFNEKDIGTRTLDELDRNTAYNGVRLRYFSDASRASFLHSKVLLIEGKYNGVADRKVTWTGSPNCSYPALRAHDETLLKLSGSSLHDQYRQHFRTVAAATDCEKTPGGAIKCDGRRTVTSIRTVPDRTADEIPRG